MANEPVVTPAPDNGIARTPDGTIAPQTPVSPPITTPPTLEPGTTPPSNNGTVLNQNEPPKPEPAAVGAPDKYTDFKVPDGFQLDPDAIAKATPVFKELGLNQDAAQKLVDTYRELTEQAVAAPREAYLKLTSDWLKEAQDHPDLRGKLGPGQEVNVRIGQLLSSLPDQKLASDFREAMDLTGVGNHPAFIRVFDHVAKLLTEGKHVAGNGPSPGGQSRPGASSQPGAAAAIWPGLKSAADTR